MEQQVVRLEIGKVLAVVIAVIAVALVANAFLQSDYFKGSLGTQCIEPASGATAEDWAEYDKCVNDLVIAETALLKEAEVLSTDPELVIKEEEATINTDPELVIKEEEATINTDPELVIKEEEAKSVK